MNRNCPNEDDYQVSFEPLHEKTCLMPYANNKGAEQLAHPRTISSFYICNIITLADQSGLSLLSYKCFALKETHFFILIYLLAKPRRPRGTIFNPIMYRG